MKRPISWSNEDDNSSSSSDSDSEADNNLGKSIKTSQVSSGKKKSGALDFEALKRHGYKGGLSVLRVPPPKEDKEPDWTWSTGQDHRQNTKEVGKESKEEQKRPRVSVVAGQNLTDVQTQKEKDKKNLSFSQKEKRKRELGQASRGKSYVEEEKRLLRESGVYSGFDT